ncbi:MAG: hypothetical protein RML72_07635 [Bacteroidia bacterium]|nr:hypothetical protein [Bacteroidia bacterium]MDW8158731.1 hypothetical protein [Bacteroidia bacterium]
MRFLVIFIAITSLLEIISVNLLGQGIIYNLKLHHEFIGAEFVFPYVRAWQGDKKLNKSSIYQQDVIVLICNSSNAYAYHSKECTGLKKCRAGIRKILLSEAQQKKLRPCRYCYIRK